MTMKQRLRLALIATAALLLSPVSQGRIVSVGPGADCEFGFLQQAINVPMVLPSVPQTFLHLVLISTLPHSVHALTRSWVVPVVLVSTKTAMQRLSR